MTRDVLIDGRPERIVLQDSRVRFGGANADEVDAEFSVEQLAPGHYSVTIGGRAMRVAIDSQGEVWVAGCVYRVEVFDPRDRRANPSAAGGRGRRQIAAPMPGKVVRVLAAIGDAVEAGQGLVVVEAMKMQNEMVSPKPGRVAEVRAREGATVRAGEILVIVE